MSSMRSDFETSIEELHANIMDFQARAQELHTRIIAHGKSIQRLEQLMRAHFDARPSAPSRVDQIGLDPKDMNKTNALMPALKATSTR